MTKDGEHPTTCSSVLSASSWRRVCSCLTGCVSSHVELSPWHFYSQQHQTGSNANIPQQVRKSINPGTPDHPIEVSPQQTRSSRTHSSAAGHGVCEHTSLLKLEESPLIHHNLISTDQRSPGQGPEYKGQEGIWGTLTGQRVLVAPMQPCCERQASGHSGEWLHGRGTSNPRAERRCRACVTIMVAAHISQNTPRALKTRPWLHRNHSSLKLVKEALPLWASAPPLPPRPSQGSSRRRLGLDPAALPPRSQQSPGAAW